MSEQISKEDLLDMYVNLAIIVSKAKEANQNTAEEIAKCEELRDTFRKSVIDRMAGNWPL
jgi:hypothetical protein